MTGHRTLGDPTGKLAKRRYVLKNLKSGLCTTCGLPNNSGTWLCEDCKIKERKRQKDRQRKLKKDALAAYGSVCFCCHEDRFEFLSIDHINGGGHKHRKLEVGSHMYRWLRENKYPPGFRAACFNCNLSIGFYGYCPHERENKCL